MRTTARIAVAALSLLLLAATPSSPTLQHVQDQAPPAEISNQETGQKQPNAEAGTTSHATEYTAPPTDAVNGKPDPQAAHTQARENLNDSWVCAVWSWLLSVTGQGWINFTMVVATALITFFNFRLVKVSRDMHNVARSSQELDGKLFAITHRPSVHVRSVAFNDAQPLDLQVVNVRLTVVNRGGTSARIIDSQCAIVFSSNRVVPSDHQEHMDGATRMDRLPDVLEPGEAHRILKTKRPEDNEISFDLIKWQILTGEFQKGNASLYVCGWIKYSDTLGLIHETAFCRRYDPPTFAFVAVQHPDYEYQE